jgi:hypothetical protein
MRFLKLDISPVLFKFLLILIFASSTFQGFSQTNNGILIDYNKTNEVKKRIQQKDINYLPAYNALIEKAEVAMNEGPFSVVDKKRTPPSGNKHDYMSQGKYWWPNPSTPDGLPYIRKDGENNPVAFSDEFDRVSMAKLLRNVESLGWAYYFSDEEKYAKKATLLLETWFVNEETKMNPHLNYAQGIPGSFEGRYAGIIDWSTKIDQIYSPIQILEANHFLSKNTKEKLFGWFEDYLDWLLTSEHGQSADGNLPNGKGRNNHGTHYDSQVVGIMLLLGKTEMAKTLLENAKSKRIASQIEPDGSQPRELARTKSLGYSAMNLRAFTFLAIMAEKVGLNLWDFETDDGRGIRKAYEFLDPFVQGKKNWEYKQITYTVESSLESVRILNLIAASTHGGENYLKIAQSISSLKTDLYFLLYPIPFK